MIYNTNVYYPAVGQLLDIVYCSLISYSFIVDHITVICGDKLKFIYMLHVPLERLMLRARISGDIRDDKKCVRACQFSITNF